MTRTPAAPSEPARNPAVAVVIGLAFTAGSVMLALLGLPSTMTLTRIESNSVTVSVETRLFNRFTIDGFRVDGVQAVDIVGHDIPATGTGPDYPAAVDFYFVTPDGQVNHGVRQKRFDRHAPEIRAFVAGDAPVVTFTGNDPAAQGWVRFALVHLVIVVMAFIGLTATWTGLRSLLSRMLRRW